MTSRGYVEIQHIQVGMHVASLDADTGAFGFKAVEAQYSNPYDEIISITVRDEEGGHAQTIASNRIHPYFVQTTRAVPSSSEGHVYQGPIPHGRWIDAGDILPGDRLLNADGTWGQVTDIGHRAAPLTAYNLTVADYHTYFVAGNPNADAVWVHNNCFDKVFTSRKAALRGAKEQAGIPRSAQPKRMYREDLRENGVIVRKPDGTAVTTRNYVYDHPKYGEVVIKEHSYGHPQFAGSAAENPHFNVGVFKGENVKIGSIPGVSGHYMFK